MNDSELKTKSIIVSDEGSAKDISVSDEVTPKDKLNLAKKVLGILALFVFTFSVMRIYIEPASAGTVFERIMQAAIPIGSLILGYYFGSSDKKP